MSETTKSQPIGVVPATGRGRALKTILDAFSTDPVVRWIVPDDNVYAAMFPAFIEGFGGRAFDHATAHGTEDLAGVALWLPPGVQPDAEAMQAAIMSNLTGADLERAGGMMEQMDAYHPEGPIWYLPLIGVDAAQRGHGYGSALLTHALQACDQQQVPAYLEATSEANKRLYERFSFVTLGEISVPGSPTMWPMLREPQS